MVNIYVEGKLYGSYSINKDQVIDVINNDYRNTVKIENKMVDVIYSNCDNQICVNEYPISKSNPFVIVCLPHEMVIEISE